MGKDGAIRLLNPFFKRNSRKGISDNECKIKEYQSISKDDGKIK
jgi:hypothetical protein